MKKFLAILLGAAGLNAYAHNCGGQFDPVSGSCRIIGPDGRQIIYNSDPPQSGDSNQSSPPKIIQHITVNVPSKYGAIAWNKKTGDIGGSTNADFLEQAKLSAIQRCEVNGQAPCEILVWVKNGCTAVASGKKLSRLTLYNAAEKPGQAEKIAIKQCEADGATNCKIVMPEGCSIPDGMYD
ncbi:DUF4189 domain-containing protein [Glaesserella sp.]|uniref:DUF4189 domain-containing protein n=1 Tax=Glaesserella sp. TaxID=2094731 RepID=UPI0035A1282E